MPAPITPSLRRSHRVRRNLPLWSHPDRTHWLAVALIVIVAVTAVGSARQSATAARRAWGTTVSVHRAVRTLEPGPVAPSDTEVVEIPSTLTPASALDAAVPVQRVARRVPQGAVITEVDMAGVARPGMRVVPVPVSTDLVPQAGQLVELAVSERVDPYGERPSEVVVIEGRVIAVHPGEWLVEVDPSRAMLLATAAIGGTVVPMLVG